MNVQTHVNELYGAMANVMKNVILPNVNLICLIALDVHHNVRWRGWVMVCVMKSVIPQAHVILTAVIAILLVAIKKQIQMLNLVVDLILVMVNVMKFVMLLLVISIKEIVLFNVHRVVKMK